MQYDLTYNDMLDLCNEKVQAYNPKSGTEMQTAMLWDIDEDSLEEAERLNIMLALIKWEIEHNMLTAELKDELYLYYEDYTKGKLTDILADYESEIVINDLTMCYKRVFN